MRENKSAHKSGNETRATTALTSSKRIESRCQITMEQTTDVKKKIVKKRESHGKSSLVRDKKERSHKT